MMLRHVYLPLSLLLLFSGLQVQAQDLKLMRKPTHEVAHPYAEPELPELSLKQPKAMPSHGTQRSQVPAYGEIHSEVRWYALEHKEDSAYWAAVHTDRLLLGLQPGYHAGSASIAQFAEAQHLGSPISSGGERANAPYVLYQLAEPGQEALLDIISAAQQVEGILYAEPSVKYTAQSTPNDPLWQYQWGPMAINAPEAWQYTTGGSWNVIAVIDDAIDWNHPDLHDMVWYGYDYGMNDSDPSPDHFNQNHGSHVTGTIAAGINNNLGIAGMVNDTVFFAKVTDQTYDPDQGNFSDVAIINALNDIAQIERVGVVNMSLGGGAPSMAMLNACNNAWNAGKLLVVASGNEGNAFISYPAAYAACMAVGSVGANGVNMYFAGYSNYGVDQEMVAPGGDYAAGFGILSSVLFNQFDAMEGTSMACPHVAGVAGLMLAANPSLTNFELRQILNSTATDHGEPGWDMVFGYGMVNAGLAVQTAVGIALSAASANETQAAIKLYPNPATEYLYIDAGHHTAEGAIEIYDLSGRLVQSHQGSNFTGEALSLQGLPRGMYVLRCQISGMWHTSKFSKI